jgi:hypothetical protein
MRETYGERWQVLLDERVGRVRMLLLGTRG